MVFYSGRFHVPYWYIPEFYVHAKLLTKMSWEKEKPLILLCLFSLKSECLHSILIWKIQKLIDLWWFNNKYSYCKGFNSGLNLRCRPDLKTFPTCLSKLALSQDQLPSEKRWHSYTVRNISSRFLKLYLNRITTLHIIGNCSWIK